MTASAVAEWDHAWTTEFDSGFPMKSCWGDVGGTVCGAQNESHWGWPAGPMPLQQQQGWAKEDDHAYNCTADANSSDDDAVMLGFPSDPSYSRVPQNVEYGRCWDPGMAVGSTPEPEDSGLIPAQSLSDQGKLVVVLDLDETLVRFREGPVYWRPHLAAFLDSIKTCCEVVLWTASTEECAARIMPELDPLSDRFHHKVFRTERWFCGVPYTKDLTLLQRDMQRTVILENTVECVTSNPDNAIMVPDYIIPDLDDTALLVTRDILLELAADPTLDVTQHLQGHRSLLTVLHPLTSVRYVAHHAQCAARQALHQQQVTAAHAAQRQGTTQQPEAAQAEQQEQKGEEAEAKTPAELPAEQQQQPAHAA